MRVYTGTGRASRRFDYEWIMLRQQNAQKAHVRHGTKSQLRPGLVKLGCRPMTDSSLSLRRLPAFPPNGTELSPEGLRSVKHTHDCWKCISKHHSCIWNKKELKADKQQRGRIDHVSSCIQAEPGFFTALTSSPAVQVAAYPWHPDLEHRSLGELFLLCFNCESHEAWVAGGGVNDWGSVICVLVCGSLSTTQHVSWLLLRTSTW